MSENRNGTDLSSNIPYILLFLLAIEKYQKRRVLEAKKQQIAGTTDPYACGQFCSPTCADYGCSSGNINHISLGNLSIVSIFLLPFQRNYIKEFNANFK